MSQATQNLAQSSTGCRIEIRGHNFHSSANSIQVELFPSLGTVSIIYCSDKHLVVDVPSSVHLAVGTAVAAKVTHIGTGGISKTVAVAVITGPLSLAFGGVPVLTNSSINVKSNITSMLIRGGNFNDNPSNLRVFFSAAGYGTFATNPFVSSLNGQVYSSQASGGGSAVYTNISEMSNRNGGNLQALMTIQGVKTPWTTVAYVNPSLPEVQESSFQVSKSSAGNRIEISGVHFASDGSDLSDCAAEVNVFFDPQLNAATTITCNNTLVVVDVSDTNTLATQNLYAIVNNTRQHCLLPQTCSLGPTIKIGSIVDSLTAAPTITATTTALPSYAHTLQINGNNFGTQSANVRIYMIPAQGTRLEASVDVLLGSFSTTQFTIRISGLTDINSGLLQAVVSVNGVRSAVANVATIEKTLPVVTPQSPLFSLAQSNGWSSVEIFGERFGVDKAAISVTLSPVLSNLEIFNCTDTKLVIRISDTNGAPLGALKAVVARESRGPSNFGIPTEFGSIEAHIVSPFAVPDLSTLPATTNTFLIAGAGFGNQQANVLVHTFISKTLSASLTSGD